MFKRLFPAPLLSASIWVMWLVLNQSVSAGHVLLGALLAIFAPLATLPLRPLSVRIRKPTTVIRLILSVGRDVVKSNLEVFRDVLHAKKEPPNGAFVIVPLTLRDPHGLAALAMITTVVPGTVWSELSLDRTELLLHVWDLEDEATFIEHYQSHYERPLKEIFE